jgi:hypothetical protein
MRAASVVPVFHGPRTERVIALTIDDDWSPARVGSIFDTLVHEPVRRQADDAAEVMTGGRHHRHVIGAGAKSVWPAPSFGFHRHLQHALAAAGE